MTSTRVLFDSFEFNPAEAAVLDICDLLCRHMVDNVVLHLDAFPVLADMGWTNFCDTAFASENLIVNYDHMIFLLAKFHTNIVFYLPVKEHPVVTELVVVHFAEVGGL